MLYIINSYLKALGRLIYQGRLGFFLVLILGLVALLWRPPQITIGLIAAQTGDFASLAGQDTINGARLAVQQSRSHRVRLVVMDDRNQPATALAAAQTLAQTKGTIAIIAPGTTSLSIPVAEYLASTDVPLITTTAQVKGTAVFPVGLSPQQQGRALARLAQQKNLKRVAVLYNRTNSYSRAVAKGFLQSSDDTDLTVVANFSYPEPTQDFRPQLAKISQAQALLLPNSWADVINQTAQLRQVGWSGQLLGSDSWATLLAGHAPLEGWYTAVWDERSPQPGNQEFIQAYRRAYGRSPTSNAALAYDAVGLILTVAGQHPTALRVKQNLRQRYQGVTGTITPQGRTTVVNKAQGLNTFFDRLIEPEKSS